MKKALSVLILVLLLCLAGCAGKEESAPEDRTTAPAPTETTAPTEIPDEPAVEGKAVTLMVYMIGSDLEAKSGAGTNDLQEMETSGVDLTNTNVVVYAGGSRKWHNEDMQSHEVHALLELTESGFEAVSTTPQSSMGEADCLSAFLNTAYEKYPARSYALILWDHGSGPLIGYGLDMLHDNDSLTLKEMSTALQASPFGADKKLAWIGFDACLMASAELACVLDEYAEILVASQEIEPNFGWNYNFLKNLGKMDPAPMLADMTQQYLAACQAYYDRKGFDHRDTTLACMDLSKAAVLEAAIESLFAKAAGDVNANYDALAASRVNTRALGRATTGSEYDLIDLNDMAVQLAGRYPAEAKAIQSAVENMIIANTTNTEGCCGLSLYYPFYNKRYYERSWRDIYQDLNAFPRYAEYLDAYCQIWLGSDKLDQFAASVMPSVKNEAQFVLELTPEQAKAFADGRYYILQREGEELYTQVFISGNVVLEGNRLIANFDGQILYGRDGIGNYIAPVVTEHDTVGNLTRYSVYANLTNAPANLFDAPEDFKQQVQGHRFHLTVDNTTKKIYTSALVPWNTSVQTESLAGGKIEDADLSQWSKYVFLHEPHRYLTRYENGSIKPIEEWPASTYLSGYQTKVDDGVEFFFAPLVTGEYYLIFEVDDTQGNSYCSELLPITADGQLEPTPLPEPIEVTWDSGEEVFLMEKEGIKLYLTTMENFEGKRYYTLKAVNTNDYSVYLSCTNPFVDNAIWCEDGLCPMFTVPADSTVVDTSGFCFGDAGTLGVLDTYSSIQFFVDAQTFAGDRTIIHKQVLSVVIGKQVRLEHLYGARFEKAYQYEVPTRDILAKEQVLFDKDGFKATLLGLGGAGDGGELVAVIRYENNSSKSQAIRLQGFAMDDIFVEQGLALEIPASAIRYKTYVLQQDQLDMHMADSPQSVKVLMQFMEYYTLEGGGGFTQTQWYPLQLTQKGKGCSFSEGTAVLYDGNGIRLSLHHVQNEYGTTRWYCTVVNTGTQSVKLSITDVTANGKAVDMNDFFSSVGYNEGKCDVGQKTIFRINGYEELGKNPTITFKLRADDLTAEKFLWVSDEVITLTCE